MKLKELRINKGLSQKEIAKIINTTQQNYARYENNQITPNIDTLKKLADFYGVSLDYLCDFNPPYSFNLPPLSVEQKEAINILLKLPLPKFYEVLGTLKAYDKIYNDEPNKK